MGVKIQIHLHLTMRRNLPKLSSDLKSWIDLHTTFYFEEYFRNLQKVTKYLFELK